MGRIFKVWMNSGAVLHYLIKENISQNELAERLSISSGYMSQLVNGRRCPSPRLRKKMLDVLSHLTFSGLFNVENKNESI